MTAPIATVRSICTAKAIASSRSSICSQDGLERSTQVSSVPKIRNRVIA